MISAASRDEALRHIELHGLRPDVILCDYQLPLGHTGVETVEEIAARLQRRPPTILLTGDITDACRTGERDSRPDIAQAR